MEQMKFVYVIHGERDLSYFGESLRCLRRFYPDAKVVVWTNDAGMFTDCKFDIIEYPIMKYDTREGNRNSSYYRLAALLASTVPTCYIDNDVNIVHPGFASGFALAEKYGLCMPINRRSFVTTTEGDMGDIDVGGDVSKYDRKIVARQIPYATSLIMGVMFFDPANDSALSFLRFLIKHQLAHPSRGQAALMRAMEQTTYYPYALPEQYCACRNLQRPLAIHTGSRKEPELMRWYESEYKK